MSDFTRPGVILVFCGALFAQSSDAPGVVIADVHPSAKSNNDNMVIVPVSHGRLEIRKATMLNLLSGASQSTPRKSWAGRTGWNSIVMT
jgi:hypothetical protein